MFRRLDTLGSHLWRRAQQTPRVSATAIAMIFTIASVAGMTWLTTRQAPHRLAGGQQAVAAEIAAPGSATSEASTAGVPARDASDQRVTQPEREGASRPSAKGVPATTSPPVAETSPPAATTSAEPAWKSLPPKEQLVAVLEEGAGLLGRVRDFKAVLSKQERRRNELSDVEELQVKMRREPLSVYLKWCDPSPPHEVLWQVGRDDDKLLYHDGGWKGRMAPVVKIDPGHKIIKTMSRRPLAKIGPWELARELAARRDNLNLHDAVVGCRPVDGPDGRPCLEFTINHPEKRAEIDNHRTVLLVDLEWKIPVGCDVYDWPRASAPDEPVLLESYHYSEIEFDSGLTDADFDPKNSAYGFRKLAGS